MEPTGLRVEELAARADVSVDTIRFYQKRRLLPAPERRGRIAWYGPEHVDRLAQIRDLQQRGFSLAIVSAASPLVCPIRPIGPRLIQPVT